MSKFRRLHVESLEARDVPSFGPIVAILATDVSASEAGTDPAVFTISRTGGDLRRPLAVQYQIDPGSSASATDFARLSGSITIPAGQLSATISVMPVDDNMYESTEYLRVAIRPAWNYRVDTAAANAEVEITDNDQAPQVLAPVLMVIANRDFYYREYADTRAELENAGLAVVVAAQQVIPSYPHPQSGQGADGGIVTPNIALTDADAANYSAIVFVGGWGSSSYQYAFAGTYANSYYNGTLAVEAAANRLINDMIDQDKYVAGLCHGVSALAWARVDGVSPLAGKTVSAYALGAPMFQYPNGTVSNSTEQTTRWHVESNGATMVQARSIGDPFTAADDVIVDGKIITAENYDSARMFGQTIAAMVSS